MTTASEFQAKTEKSVTNMDRLDLFVNGNIAATVTTDSGVIPSLAKVVADIQAELDAGSIDGIPGLTAALAAKVDDSELAGPGGSAPIGFIQAGTGAVATTVQSRLRETISVKDFGAVGDGVTDDTAAIQLADTAATALGVALFFPAGRYVVTGNGIFMGGASWYGVSRTASALVAKAVTFTNLSGLVSCQSKSNFTVSDIGFDMSAGTYPAGVGNPGNIYWALAIQLCQNWRVFNCAFIGIKAQCQGLAVDAGSNFDISSNFFQNPSPTNTYCQAINISFASGLPTIYRIANNTMNGCALFSNGARGVIANNLIYGWKFGGALTFGPNAGGANHIIIGNTIFGGAAAQDINAVWISGIECWSPYSIIANNYVENCAGDGIGTGGFATKIIGNTCLNNGRGDGTTVGVGSGITINSITISGLNYEGSRSSVIGNTVLDTQGVPTQKYGIAEFVVDGPAMVAIDYADNTISGFVTAKQLFTAGQRAYRGQQQYQESNCTVPSLTAGASYDETIFMAGVRTKDKAVWGFSGDSRGYSVIPHIVDDNVILTVTNVSGATKDAPVGQTWTLFVEKAPNTTGY